MNFTKLIEKARRYPGRTSWLAQDPDSYNLAREHNILERPECARHMDPAIRAKVALDHALTDMLHYRTHSQWRHRSPVMFWAAYEAGWLENDEVIAHLGKKKQSFDFHDIRREARKHSTLEGWRKAPGKAYQVAVDRQWHAHPDVIGHMRKLDVGALGMTSLIQAPGYLIFEGDIERISGPGIRDKLQEWCARNERWRVYPVSEGVYAKPQLAQLPHEEIRDALARDLEKLFDIRIHCSCDFLARSFDIPHKAHQVDTYEAQDFEIFLDLTEVFGRGRMSDHFAVRKVPASRLIDPGTPHGDALRALSAVPRSENLDKAVQSVLDRLNGETLLRIRTLLPRASSGVSAAVRRYLD